jgi:hypothetical protein
MGEPIKQKVLKKTSKKCLLMGKAIEKKYKFWNQLVKINHSYMNQLNITFSRWLVKNKSLIGEPIRKNKFWNQFDNP